MDVDIASEFYVALGRLVRTLRQRTASERPVGASGMSLLKTLVAAGPVRASALAEIEGVAAASITRTVNALEVEGLARRMADPSDGRAQLVEATESGRVLITSGTEAKVAFIRGQVERLTEDEREQLRAVVPILEKLSSF